MIIVMEAIADLIQTVYSENNLVNLKSFMYSSGIHNVIFFPPGSIPSELH